jgi:hypothetical protein
MGPVRRDDQLARSDEFPAGGELRPAGRHSGAWPSRDALLGRRRDGGRVRDQGVTAGIKPEDVKITIHGDTLTIRGESKAEDEKQGTHWHIRERHVSSLARSLSLRAPINADAASAHFDHGVLTLTLPKKAEAKPKEITVTTGSTTPASSEQPGRPAEKGAKSGTGKSSPADRPPNPGGKPEPTHDVAAEQSREAHESEAARNAVASSRERMVDIGRGNQQAGRQGQ